MNTKPCPEKRIDIAARIMAARIAAGETPNPEWVVMRTDRLIEELKKSQQ